jgi:hypothetical protein
MTAASRKEDRTPDLLMSVAVISSAKPLGEKV